MVSARVRQLLAVTTMLGLALASGGLPAAAVAPRATVLRAVDASTPLVVVGDESSEVVAMGNGVAAADAAAREGRARSHSDLQPTGRFVRAGATVTFDVHGPGGTVSWVVAAIGTYSDLNGGTTGTTNPTRTPLPAGATTVTAPVDGMVYLVNTSGTDVAVTVTATATASHPDSGPATGPVPVYVLGQTTAAGFRAQLERWPRSRFVTLVGARVCADLQRSEIDARLRTQPDWDPAVPVTYWDDVVAAADEVHGLLPGAVGAAHRSRPRIHVINQDDGAGWAYATQRMLSFQVRTGAGQDLLAAQHGENFWGLWHEVGHTYQDPEYTWDDMTEVQVNVYSASIQDRLGTGTRYTATSTARQAADRLLALPVDQRPDHGTAHELMLEQLRRAFGPAFYPRLHQEYRVRRATEPERAVTHEAMIQLFIRTASRVADRDLAEFFRQWGLRADAETVAATSALPPLAHPLWETLDPAAMPLEDELPAYSVPTATVRGTGDVRLGQTTLPEGAAAVGDLGDTGRDAVPTVLATGVSTTHADDPARVWAVLVNDVGVREVVWREVAPRRGDGLTFRGISDAVIVTLSLARDTGTLQAFSDRSSAAHPYFPDEVYVSAELRAADGGTRARAELLGTDSGAAFAAALTGVPYADGDYLLVTHQEAGIRLDRFVADVEQPRDAATAQAFVIEDGSLLPTSAEGVPAPTPADLTADEVPAARVGVALELRVSATGTGPVEFATLGDLPPGLALEATGTHAARIVGTPEVAGTWGVTVAGQGAVGGPGRLDLVLEVAEAEAGDEVDAVDPTAPDAVHPTAPEAADPPAPDAVRPSPADTVTRAVTVASQDRSTGGGDLARTGAAPAVAGGTALLLLVAGAALVAGAQRTRARRSRGAH